MKKYKVLFSLSGPGINFMQDEEFDEKRYKPDVLEMAMRAGAVKEIKEKKNASTNVLPSEPSSGRSRPKLGRPNKDV